MYMIDHIRAYWLSRAMAIPGGASNADLKVEYWSAVAHMNSADRLSR